MWFGAILICGVNGIPGVVASEGCMYAPSNVLYKTEQECLNEITEGAENVIFGAPDHVFISDAQCFYLSKAT